MRVQSRRAPVILELGGYGTVFSKFFRILRRRVRGTSDPHLSYVQYSRRKPKHQIEFRRNEQKILLGQIPERLENFREMIPGSRILEIGSADGSLALALGRTKEKVIGLELTKYRHETAERVKSVWLQRGEAVSNVEFHCEDVSAAANYLDDIDCLVLSRTLYHLQEKAEVLFDQVERNENVKFIALLGNRDKEARLFDGSGIKKLDNDYLSLASLSGMKRILENHGFKIVEQVASTEHSDPIVIGARLG